MAARSVVALLLVSSVQPMVSKQIRDGEETEIHLEANTDSRLSFQTPFLHYPLWLWITPCGEPVEWQLEYEGKSSGPVNLYQTADHTNENFNSLGHTTVVFDVHSETAALGNKLIDAPNKVVLAHQTGSQRMKYYSISVPTETVTLVMRAQKAALVRVFITTALRTIDQVYPQLPVDGAKRKLHQSSDVFDPKNQLYSTLVQWTPSESASLFDMKLQYCVSVSDERAIETMCELNGGNGVRSMNCVNHTVNEHRIGGLRPGRQYHVTVFAVNMATGTSTAYESLALKLPYPVGEEAAAAAAEHQSHQRRPHNAFPLYDARLQAGKLEARRGAAINFNFLVRPHQNDQKVLLVFHACAGYIRVSIYRDGKLLRKSDTFTGYRRFMVVNAKEGRLRVRVTNGDKRENVFKVWASVRSDKNPYPELPDDTSVKETGRTCSSTTLQWLRSGGHARYCLYRRRESVNYLDDLIKQNTDHCVGSPPSTELVGCFNDYGNATAGDRVSALMQTTVEGLEAGAAYRFDLLARPLHRAHSQQLPYRTLWVKTRQFC
uniref:Protein NDNF n=1 Tax=Plectus sambesii TaxID=2011161 RepID=A0A914W2H1_9BILA